MVEKENILLKSDKLSEGEMEEKRQEVKKWVDYGYCKMSILHFLSEECEKVSGFLEDNNFVINLG